MAWISVRPKVIRLFLRNENKTKTFNCAQDSHLLATCLKQNLSNFCSSDCFLFIKNAICSCRDEGYFVQYASSNMCMIWQNYMSKAWKQRLCLIVFWKLKSHFVTEFVVLVLHWSQFCSEQTLTQTKERLWMKLGERIVWNEWKLNYTLKNSLSALHNSVLCISFRL